MFRDNVRCVWGQCEKTFEMCLVFNEKSITIDKYFLNYIQSLNYDENLYLYIL